MEGVKQNKRTLICSRIYYAVNLENNKWQTGKIWSFIKYVTEAIATFTRAKWWTSCILIYTAGGKYHLSEAFVHFCLQLWLVIICSKYQSQKTSSPTSQIIFPLEQSDVFECLFICLRFVLCFSGLKVGRGGRPAWDVRTIQETQTSHRTIQKQVLTTRTPSLQIAERSITSTKTTTSYLTKVSIPMISRIPAIPSWTPPLQETHRGHAKRTTPGCPLLGRPWKEGRVRVHNLVVNGKILRHKSDRQCRILWNGKRLWDRRRLCARMTEERIRPRRGNR